jgi:hypothetical protein
MLRGKDPLAVPYNFAERGRRILHLALAGGGWLLFGYWWWIVFQHVTRQEIVFTLLFLGIALVFVVAVTITWVVHNIRIARRGRRRQARIVPVDLRRDSVGRLLIGISDAAALQHSAVVSIRLRDDGKVYESLAAQRSSA